MSLCAGRAGHILNMNVISNSTKTINDSFFKGLNYYAALSTKKIKSHCVYGGEEQYVYKGHEVLGWNKLMQLSIK